MTTPLLELKETCLPAFKDASPVDTEMMVQPEGSERLNWRLAVAVVPAVSVIGTVTCVPAEPLAVPPVRKGLAAAEFSGARGARQIAHKKIFTSRVMRQA